MERLGVRKGDISPSLSGKEWVYYTLGVIHYPHLVVDCPVPGQGLGEGVERTASVCFRMDPPSASGATEPGSQNPRGPYCGHSQVVTGRSCPTRTATPSPRATACTSSGHTASPVAAVRRGPRGQVEDTTPRLFVSSRRLCLPPSPTTHIWVDDDVGRRPEVAKGLSFRGTSRRVTGTENGSRTGRGGSRVRDSSGAYPEVPEVGREP